MDEIHMDGTKYTWFTKLQVILKRNNRKALSLMFGLIIAQQLGQHYITMQYPEKFYRKINIVNDSYTAMFMVQLVNFLSSCYTVFRVDSDGRRTLLLLSTGGTAVTLTTIAFYLFISEETLRGSVFNYLMVIVLIVYQVTFQVGLGTIPTLLLCELFPAELKGFVGAIIVLFESIIGYIASIQYQAILNIANASAVYTLFASSCSLALMMVYLQIPETKGKTYSEIEELLGGKNLNSSNEEARSDESDIYRL
jgi:MFS transporter, SP family, ERD6-like sugar transporter